ncbi:MAG: hypothetical protein AB7S71_09005 [Dongiaceae bacterium]
MTTFLSSIGTVGINADGGGPIPAIAATRRRLRRQNGTLSTKQEYPRNLSVTRPDTA